MPQSLHPDFQTTIPDTDYFVLGSGKMQATIQWSRDASCTPLGILLSDPKHFARKWSTHLFHPEYGLAKTMLTLIIDGVRYQPDTGTRVVWYPDHIPGVTALWNAGGLDVIEHFWTCSDESVVVREVTLGSEKQFETAELEIALYANPALYSEFVGNSYGLGAKGYEQLTVTSMTPGVFRERILTVPVEFRDGLYRAQIYYSFGADAVRPARELYAIERSYWEEAGIRWTEEHPMFIVHEMERLFASSAMGLRAAVAENGRFDASIWQYGYEWSGDASIVVEALVYSGQFEVAKRVLTNILERLTIAEGMAMESSRFRGGQDSELNNNGEILKACRTYLEWTGDLAFIDSYYERIRAIADYLLRPEFLIEETGMVSATRDIWERSGITGMLPGYDVAHQTFAILGLRDAAKIAKYCGNEDDAVRWKEACYKMRASFLEHPTHSMIEEGRIIKRRLLDGSVQRELLMTDDSEFRKHFVPQGMPLANAGARSWEPDVSECFPICYGVIDPRSEVARKTIASMQELWGQAWEGGGYGRYNVLSEPDSPGPWPFATMFVAAAAIEAGEHETAMNALSWLVDAAGAGGSWLEFYGDRPTPPLPPTGIIVWAWAQWITLIVRHILGADVRENQLLVRPRLGGFTGRIRFRDTFVDIP